MSRRSHHIGNASTPPDSEALNSPHSAAYSDNNSSMEVSSKKRGKRKRQKDNSSQGRWTDEEHRQFVEGLKLCGKNWKKLEHYVPTRNSTQIRSHAQKFFIKIEKQHHTKDALEFIRSMKDEVASNCSHSVMSTCNRRQCDCEVHSKPPQKFGNHLNTDFTKEYESMNAPCDCQCDKCKGYNRHILDETKIERIKKRVNKAISKIERLDAMHNSAGYNGLKTPQKSRGYSQDTREQEESLKLIRNLSGLSLLLKVTGGFSESGKPSLLSARY